MLIFVKRLQYQISWASVRWKTRLIRAIMLKLSALRIQVTVKAVVWHLTTSWIGYFLRKLTFCWQFSTFFFAFCGTRKFITAFAGLKHLVFSIFKTD